MHLPPLILLLLPLLFVRTSCLPRPPALLPRQPFCANAPHTPAGTTLFPRKSTNTILWCAPSSRTYVILEMVSLLPTDAVGALLDEAINSVLGHVDVWGDGNVPGGLFNWEANGLSLATWNSNNHQQTWAVLGAALEALEDYMKGTRYGQVWFTIIDGQNEVGKGRVS